MSQHKHLDRAKRVAVSFIYNPENQSRDELIDGFVIRVRQFKKILRSITSTELDAPPQHFLIEGQRGAGKTSLMLRLRYELDGTPSDHILPLQLPEEQYGIFNLCALWEHVADELEEVNGFSGIVEAFDLHAHDQQYDIDCFDLLDRYLENNAKRLVLFLDNFGDLLDRLSEIEHKRLRDIFHTSKRIQLIAGSARTLEQTYKYDKPFYEFFKIERLESLSNVETISLLRSLAKQHNAVSEINEIALEEPEKIESLRLLSGGVPRTIVFLFEVLLDQNGDVFDDLEALLDRVTPLYKNRMDDLPRQQQAIVNIIALAWDGVSNKDIVEALKSKEFDSRKVASQLSQLEASDTVFSKKIDKKNKIYFIKERFFNIWYLMRLARKRDKARVKWLVSFLQVLYSSEQIEHRGWAHIKKIRDGGVSHKAVERWTPVLADASSNKELHQQLISTRDQYLQSIGESEKRLPDTTFQTLADEVLEGTFQTLSALQEALKKQGSLSDPEVHYFQGLYHRYKKDYEQAEQSFVESLQSGFKRALIGLGNLYREDLSNYGKAVEFYQQAIEQGVTGALLNLANLYGDDLKDYDKAIEFYKQAIEQGDTRALLNLGYVYGENLKDYNKAIEIYQRAAEQGVKGALLFLGDSYYDDLKDFDKAIATYQQAIEQGDTRALLHLGNLYHYNLKDYDKAIETYQQAIEQGDKDALLDLGNLYGDDLKDYDKAIETYQQAIEQGDKDALLYLGYLYDEGLKDYDKAIEIYQQAVEQDIASALNDLSWLYFEENHVDKKPEALALSARFMNAALEEITIEELGTRASILLWCDKFDEAYEISTQILSKPDYRKKVGDVMDFFIFLMAKNQRHMALNLFEQFTSLKDEIKPVYYALMQLLKDEFPKEHIKMGSELEEPVAKVLEKIRSVQERYEIG
jgi:TPR repeat protein